MTFRLKWAPSRYEAGISNVALYSGDSSIAWSGVVGVETQDLIEEAFTYFDGNVVGVFVTSNSMAGVVKCLNIDDIVFGREYQMTYRTETDQGYKIHLISRVVFGEPRATYITSSKKLDVSSYVVPFHATPVLVKGIGPLSHIVFDASVNGTGAISAIEKILYGSKTTEPRYPTLDELYNEIDTAKGLEIIDHGDGTWTANAYAEGIIKNNPDESFTITYGTVIYTAEDTYNVTSG